MKKRIYIISFLFAICLSDNFAQELVVIDKGEIHGAFNEKIGMEGGTSVDITTTDQFTNISFSGSEVWAGVYLNNINSNNETEAIDLSTYKYLSFTIKSNAPIIFEKIGYGKEGEKSDLIHFFPITTEWKTIIIELSDGLNQQAALFSAISIIKAELHLKSVKYLTQLPEKDENTLLMIAAPKERLEDVTYVFSEKFETGSPSGYSGQYNGSSITLDGHCMEEPYRGKYCIKMTIDDKEDWRGLFFQVTGKWTSSLSPSTKLPDLSEYNKLVFYARTPEKGYYFPSIGFGDKGNLFSQEPRNIVFVEIGKTWQRYEIDLRGLDRSSVNDVMMFSLNEGTVYLDEIRFEK